MEHLSEAEKVLLAFWCLFVRIASDKLIRPTLLYYLMTEVLIAHYEQLPEKKRPPRPSEKAVNQIGTTSGALSKWRKKWQRRIWQSLPISQLKNVNLPLEEFVREVCITFAAKFHS